MTKEGIKGGHGRGRKRGHSPLNATKSSVSLLQIAAKRIESLVECGGSEGSKTKQFIS